MAEIIRPGRIVWRPEDPGQVIGSNTSVPEVPEDGCSYMIVLTSDGRCDFVAVGRTSRVRDNAREHLKANPSDFIVCNGIAGHYVSPVDQIPPRKRVDSVNQFWYHLREKR